MCGCVRVIVRESVYTFVFRRERERERKKERDREKEIGVHFFLEHIEKKSI